MCVCICVCMYVCVCVCMRVCMYVCMYVYMYICIHAYVYSYVYIFCTSHMGRNTDHTRIVPSTEPLTRRPSVPSRQITESLCPEYTQQWGELLYALTQVSVVVVVGVFGSICLGPFSNPAIKQLHCHSLRRAANMCPTSDG